MALPATRFDANFSILWPDELERSGYDGWVGLEHLPSAEPSDTFAWLDRWR